MPHCPEDTFYSLSFTKLEGICTSLEDSGFTVLDDDVLEMFHSIYGSRLPRGDSPNLPAFTNSKHTNFVGREYEQEDEEMSKMNFNEFQINSFNKANNFPSNRNKYVSSLSSQVNSHENDSPFNFHVITYQPDNLDFSPLKSFFTR